MPIDSLPWFEKTPQRIQLERSFSLPPLPLLDPIINWTPARPHQASAIAIRVDPPIGPPIEHIQVQFGGREVRLAMDEGGWIGIGAVPFDNAGLFELEVQYARGESSRSRTLLVPVQIRTYPSTRIGISARTTDVVDPDLDARILREREMIRSALRSSGSTWLPEGPIGWPRQPPIKTSPFGQRRVFNQNVQSHHMGLDLRAHQGHPIFAPATGRVILAERFVYQGNAIYLDHGLGLITSYFHMSRLEVKAGDVVQEGEVLGRSGSTGRSTAPHLHWAAYVDGVTVDPESLIGFAPLTREFSSR